MRPRTARTLALGLLFAAALVVRLGWVADFGRLRFDGHERLYLRAFQGEAIDASSRAWPLLLGLYRWLPGDDPRLLVVFSATAGALAVVGAALWTGRHFGAWAGAWTGILVALLGEHAAWSTSATNVILPQALLIWAFLVPRGPAALLIALACSMRGELVIFGLLRGWPGLAGLVGPLWLWKLGAPVPTDPWLALRANLPMLRFLGPPALLLGLLGLGPRPARPLLGVALLAHLSGAMFADYGARHALIGGVAMCALVGIAAARWGGLVALVAAVAMARDTNHIARIWYARPPPPDATLALPALPADCLEVTEEPPIPGQALPSHLLYLAGEIGAPCVVWGEESFHEEWNSRGLRDRALRMRTLYRLTPVAKLVRGSDTRVYQRLERRW